MGDNSNEKHHSIMPYFYVLITLWVLTVVTWGAALIHFPNPIDDIVALGIAMTKASVVVYFFMHVKGSTPLIKLAAGAGFFWVAIFFIIVLTDYMARSPFAGWG